MDTNSFPTPFIVTVFMGATAFNQDISNWNTGSVTTMSNSTYHLSFHPFSFCCIIIYILISIFVFLMFSFFFFSFLFQLKQIFINNNELFEWIPTLSQPRSLSQCSIGLQHLIRTSPIGTRGVSRPCLAVRNISLFTHSLFVVYYSYSYISIFVFLIFSFFFFFFSIQTNLHPQQ